MEISAKEALAFIIAVVSVGIIIGALYNMGNFVGIGRILEGVM